MGKPEHKDLRRKELAHSLRVHPRQTFLLRNRECEVLVGIIIDLFKKAFVEGRGIDLDGFGRMFMFEMGPRRLFNYKLRCAIEVKKSYMAKMKLKPQLRRAVRYAQKERDNA